jgi:hypothetical protein
LLAAIVGLYGCQGGPGPTLPGSLNNAQLSDSISVTPNASDPCNIPGKWYLKGACVEGNLATSSIFDLATYQNIAMTINVGPSNASGTVTFVVGDATGKHDITGMEVHFGKFPYYGSSCETSQLKTVKCPGSSLIYFETENRSQEGVTLKSYPAVTITNSGVYPGTTCELDWLGYNPSTNKFAWVEGRSKGKPSNGKLVLKATPLNQTLPGGDGYVYAIACY